MRHLEFFALCFLFVGFLRGDLWESYHTNFWNKKKEVPRWKSSAIGKPLSFEVLRIAETPDNISAIDDEIKSWTLDECLFALNVLVQRDMAALKAHNGVSRATFERDVECFASFGEDETCVQEDFSEKVLFAVYNIEKFRPHLKSRLRVLEKNPALELQKIVGRYWFNETRERRLPIGDRTPPLLFGKYAL